MHGIDVSMQMINAALRRCAPLSNVHLLKVTGRDLADYSDSSFDAVIAVDTFPHINSGGRALVDRYLRKSQRVLSREGISSSSTSRTGVMTTQTSAR